MNRKKSVSATTDRTTLNDYAKTFAFLLITYFTTIEALRFGLWLTGGAA